jgi:DNA-binding response OmpR family regulator
MPTLLVIEDELEVTDYLKEYFKHHGIEVFSAGTGEEGLAVLKQKKPDLVLLDMKLGAGISGMEVLRRAKEAGSTAQIIVVTAVEDQNVADMAKGLGAAGYVTKPLTMQAIEKVVLSRLKK